VRQGGIDPALRGPRVDGRGRGAGGMLCDAVPGRVACLAAALFLVACRTEHGSLTVAVALLPSELPVYRALVADFERDWPGVTRTREVLVLAEELAGT